MKYVTAADGVKLAYDVAGEGPPLLCLPGLTRNMEDFEPRGGRFRRPRHGHPHGFPRARRVGFSPTPPPTRSLRRPPMCWFCWTSSGLTA